MKKLLLLLLCVPLIGLGQETGCIEGDCENGKGTYTYTETLYYVGDFKNGRFHGKGTHYYSDGKLEAEWEDGDPSQGTYTYNNGDKWTGEFGGSAWDRYKGSWIFPNVVEIGECISGDCINGKGVYQITRGEHAEYKYEGEFKDGKMNGNGTLYCCFDLDSTGFQVAKDWLDNELNFTYYKGEFKDGKIDGHGIYTSRGGGYYKYIGGWKDDKYHGQGKYTWSGNEYYYEGEWKYGAKHGQGIYKDAYGLYDGEFQNDKKHGRGIMTYHKDNDFNYETYNGEWKYGKWDGIGTLTYKSGSTHVGEFEEGYQDGRGIMTYSDGSKRVGEWEFGEGKNTTSIDKDGNEKRTVLYINGEKLSTEELFEFIDELTMELQTEESAKWKGNGSGIILSKSGYIVTNYHVIQNTTEIQVSCNINDEVQRFNAEIVKVDEKNDLAIIKIKDNNFKELDELPYNFQTKSRDIGTTVYAYGYPMASIMGKDIKVTNGMISSTTGILGDETTYQITAPIQPGNSGGPLFDDRGNFIGITSSKIKEEVATTDNVAYATKSEYIQKLTHFISELFVELPSNNKLESLSLVEQIKEISKYVVLIRIK